MKKFLTLVMTVILAVTAILGLTACGKDSKPMILKDVTLLEEQYGIAAKKGNESLISKVNEALIAIADDEMKDVAKTYGLESEIAVTATTTNPLVNATDNSWSNLVSRNKVIIGYTIFAPIAYEVVEEVPTKGYDIDLAKEVFAYLNETYNTNIEIEFLKIEWKAKEAMLESGSLDLVWNGLTITDERSAEMCISVPYLNNKQVALVMSDSDYTDIASLNDAIAGAEDGSAGEEQIAVNNIGKEYIVCKSQLDAYNMLKTGTLNVIVIDSVMANYYISLEK